jgi:phosphatidylinositol glycan class W
MIDYHFLRDQTTPVLFTSVNQNQLIIFLLANVLTGLVNISTDTLASSDLNATVIVSIYMFTVGVIAMALRFFKISIKL